MSAETKKPVINVADVPTIDWGKGDQFEARLGRVGPLIGAKALGCSLTVVPPGKRAFPFHAHHANEEMFIILSGEGDYRFGDKTYPIKAGDVLAAPAGGAETAHQIINSGTGELRYLSLSTGHPTEVVEYPDSQKFAVLSRMIDGNPRSATVRYFGRKETSLNYWDGEA